MESIRCKLGMGVVCPALLGLGGMLVVSCALDAGAAGAAGSDGAQRDPTFARAWELEPAPAHDADDLVDDCPLLRDPATVVCPVEVTDYQPTDVWHAKADIVHIDGPTDLPIKQAITTICNFCRLCEMTVDGADESRDGSCLATGLEFIEGCDDPPETITNEGCMPYSFTIAKPSDEVWKKALAKDLSFFGQYCRDYLDKNPKRIDEFGNVCSYDYVNGGSGATYIDHDGVCCDRKPPADGADASGDAQ